METLLLDGGLGHLLKAVGLIVEHLPYDQQFLASAIANVDRPDLVVDCHAQYLTAGCSVITTNTFVCTPHSLAKIGRANQLHALLQGAVNCATSARALSGSMALVAGCVPPLKESYQVGNLGNDEELVAGYRDIVGVLAEAGVDVLLCETLSSVKEVRCACAAASAAGKPVWVSVTLDDSLEARLRSGESIQAAVRAALEACPGLQAFLLNCCAPAAVSAALPVLRNCLPAGVRFGAYANGFKKTTSEWLSGNDTCPLQLNSDDYDEEGLITPTAYCEAAADWVEAGASIVGGCCGVGPEHLVALRQLLHARRPAATGATAAGPSNKQR